MEGEGLLEEMLHVVGVRAVSAGDGSGGDRNSGIPAAVATASTALGAAVGREPLGPFWHRVMLVPENFAATLTLPQQHSRRGAPDVGGASSLGPGRASAELPPASSLHPLRVDNNPSRHSIRCKSTGSIVDGSAPLRSCSDQCEGGAPEHVLNRSLSRRRASFIPSEGHDSAELLRVAAGEGQGVRVKICGLSSDEMPIYNQRGLG